MPLKPIANQGLQVAEPEYLPLKAYQSGGFYWDPAAQKVLRSVLGEFLPPLIQDWNGSQRIGWFQLIEGGKEILWQSCQANSQNPVPARQLGRLQRGLERLAEKAQADETTPTNRFILREFRLPDFEHDPELYRLSGPFWNRRLHILWGCERVAESSLTPARALAKLPARHFPKWLRWLAAILAALLLLWLLSQLFAGGCQHHPPGNSGSVGAASAKGGGGDSLPGGGGDSLPGGGGALPGGGGADGGNGSGHSPAGGGGGPSGNGQNSPPSSAASASSGNNPTTSPANAPSGEFQIEKLGEKTLPDGRLHVQFVIKDVDNSEAKLAVDQWEVDGAKVSSNRELAQDLTVGKHQLAVRFHKPDGSAAEASAWVTVATEETATIEPAK